MKLKILMILLGCILKMNAQDYQFSAGIEQGPNYSMLRGNEMILKIYDPLVKYAAGLSLQWNLHEHYALRSGCLFEEKGASMEIDLTDETGTGLGTRKFQNRYRYVTIPLMFRVTYGKRLSWFFNAGPGLSMLVQVIPAFEYGTDPMDSYNKWDVTFLAGTGMNIALGKSVQLSLELRNNLGLLNISSVPVYNDGTIKTNSTMLMIGIAKKIFSNKNQ